MTAPWEDPRASHLAMTGLRSKPVSPHRDRHAERRPDKTECYDLRPGHEQRLNVSTSGHLRVRRLEALTQLSLQDERARNKEGVLQIRRSAQRNIEKGIAEIGPLGPVLAPK